MQIEKYVSRDKLEVMLSVALFTAIFLPVRFLFYTYVSSYWLGSAGVISAIMFVLWYFSYKNPKLGYVGKILLKEMNWLQSGRKAKAVMMWAGITLTFLGSWITLSIMGDTVYVETKEMLAANLPEDSRTITPDAAIEQLQKQSPQDILTNMMAGFAVMFSRIDFLTSVVALVNDMSSGWIMHMMTVFFVEEIEGLTIFFLYRQYVWKRQNPLKPNF